MSNLLHDEWREPRKKEDNSFEPRIKKTKDEDWVKKSGTDEEDIANTYFSELPSDWQEGHPMKYYSMNRQMCVPKTL